MTDLPSGCIFKPEDLDAVGNMIDSALAICPSTPGHPAGTAARRGEYTIYFSDDVRTIVGDNAKYYVLGDWQSESSPQVVENFYEGDEPLHFQDLSIIDEGPVVMKKIRKALNID